MQSPQHRGVFLPLLASVMLCFDSSNAHSESEFVELGRHLESISVVAPSRFAKVDVDSDDKEDLVFLGHSGSPILLVVGKTASGTIDFKMAEALESFDYIVRLLAWTADDSGVVHILTLTEGGVVRDYSGWPLAEQRSFSVTGDATGAAVGDMDNDGVDELLVVASNGLHAYSMDDGSPKWSYPVNFVRDIALAQLDADPALEIVLAGVTPGLVLDGATRATDWEHIDGFGTRVSTGSLETGGGVQWVGARAFTTFTVFRASPWAPIWSGGRPSSIEAIDTAHIDPMGLDAIVVGEGSRGGVLVYDGTSHAERLRIPNEGMGINDAVAVDFDGDGLDEIAFASESTFLDGPLITVASSVNGSSVWQYTPLASPYIATALGDVDGDGSVELVSASGYGTHSVIAVFDAESGVEEWRSTNDITDPNDPRYMSVATIRLVPRIGESSMDIVLAGNNYSYGRICVLDGMTKQIRLQIGDNSLEPMANRYISDMALLDFGADGIEDYLVATQPYGSGSSGARLQLFSGFDGDAPWASETMGTGEVEINGVFLAVSPTDPVDMKIVAVLAEGLRAYDGSTGALAWTIPIANDGASFIPAGATGAEIAIYSSFDGTIRFYDVDTQVFLREITLPVPVTAVTTLNGDLHAMLMTTAGKLALVDGETGVIRSSTDFLGEFQIPGTRISSIENDDVSWTVAVGAESALYRFSLEPGDTIFSNSFDLKPGF